MDQIDVPVDIFESPTEIVILLPLGGVQKDSLDITLDGTELHISGTRVRPTLKETLLPSQERCFWGDFSKKIDLPDEVYFDRIHSELSPTNILRIVVPKVTHPEKISIDIK